MTKTRAACLWGAAIALSGAAHAQRIIRGEVRDVVTGLPAAGVTVSPGIIGRVKTDSAGRFRVTVPSNLTAVQLAILCPSQTWNHAIALRRMPVEMTSSAVTLPTIDVDRSHCQEPAVDSITVELRGHVITGYHASEFTPCTGSLESLWDRDVSPAAVRFDGQPTGVQGGWPKPFTDDTAYVRWVGNLKGPGDYGHWGMTPYQWTVRHIHEIRRPGANDCR